MIEISSLKGGSCKSLQSKKFEVQAVDNFRFPPLTEMPVKDFHFNKGNALIF